MLFLFMQLIIQTSFRTNLILFNKFVFYNLQSFEMIDLPSLMYKFISRFNFSISLGNFKG